MFDERIGKVKIVTNEFSSAFYVDFVKLYF